MRRKEGVVNRHHFNKNAFFDFFLRRLSTRPTPGASCIPRRWRPLPTPAHPERLSSTGSSAGRARYTRADKYQCIPQPGRWTRCTGLHSIPDRPRRDNRTGRGALDCLRIVSETVQIWTQRSGSKKYLICEYICCTRNAKPLYSVSKV